MTMTMTMMTSPTRTASTADTNRSIHRLTARPIAPAVGRAATRPAITGRAMAVFTMAMFLGVAAMQWFTGLVASLAAAQGAEPFTAVLASIAALLAAGALAFTLLPGPPQPA